MKWPKQLEKYIYIYLSCEFKYVQLHEGYTASKFVTEVVLSTNGKLETLFSCCELSFRVQNVGSLPGSQSASTRSPIVSGRRFV